MNNQQINKLQGIQTKSPFDRLMISILLCVISIVLKWIVTLFSIIVMPLYYPLALAFGWRRPILWRWFYNMAISNDQHAACVNGTTLQVFTTKKGAHKFGNPDDTASYVYGRNKYIEKNNGLGRLIVAGLNKIDSSSGGHTYKAIIIKKLQDEQASKRFEHNQYFD